MKHDIQLTFGNLIKVRIIEYVEAKLPFVHQDRCVDYNVFLYILSGEMRIWEDNIEYIVRSGDIFFLKSNVQHWGKTEIPKGTSWYYIHFYVNTSSSDFNGVLDNNSFVKNQEFLWEDYEYYISMPKQLKYEYPVQLEKKLIELCDIYKSENSLRLINLSLKATELFYHIYSNYRSSIKADKADVITQKLILYLQDNLTCNINSDSIVDYLHLNYNYASQVFRNKTGMSLKEYHTKLRIAEASRLLRESSMNISEISNYIGYEDPLYFSHVFKKITGMSPTEYLKQAYSLGRQYCSREYRNHKK